MHRDGSPHNSADFRLVANIGLSVAAASLAGLVVVLWVVHDPQSSEYGEMISAVGMVKEALLPAMLVFTLSITVFAGVTAWLFSLYASFRIAGPLFRIARNLENLMQPSAPPPLPIRSSDRLQTEWTAFAQSVSAVRRHKDVLGQALTDFESILANPCAATATEELKTAAARLREIADRVAH